MMQNETTWLHNKTVDRFNQEKLYLQLTRIFLDQILSGHWEIDSQIPTEAELCQQYGVSKITVRQAIKNLAGDGYLLKIQGKGTFVKSSDQTHGFAMKTRFTDNMFGKEVQVKREVVTRGVQSAESPARGYLKTQEDIYCIVSQRVVEGQPISMEESYIPVSMLPGASDLDFTERSLLATLQERGTKKIGKIIQTVEIAAVHGQNARHLGVTEGVPGLVIHRLFLGSDETPVAYTKFSGRSDRYQFQTEFERIR
ncbi:MAG: GntR family transcriptional regulator [Desulfobulbaceae bacterium]|nr:GntR family transcriptional regulator [Desulfobulbaceae bacterium]